MRRQSPSVAFVNVNIIMSLWNKWTRLRESKWQVACKQLTSKAPVEMSCVSTALARKKIMRHAYILFSISHEYQPRKEDIHVLLWASSVPRHIQGDYGGLRLDFVELNSRVPPVGPFAMPSLPNLHLPKQDWADRGKNQSNSTKPCQTTMVTEWSWLMVLIS